jgi:DnaJ-class molecular chaperone
LPCRGAAAVAKGLRIQGMADRRDGDAYSVLGVLPDADDETISSAYRTLARRYHPDVAGEAGTRRMMHINAAFEAIRTRDLRVGYERSNRPALKRDGTGGAGAPPGRPSGSVLDFGRHVGWSLGEIARVDPGYLVWLSERPEGEPFREEIDAILGVQRARKHEENATPWRRGYGYR